MGDFFCCLPVLAFWFLPLVLFLACVVYGGCARLAHWRSESRARGGQTSL